MFFDIFFIKPFLKCCISGEIEIKFVDGAVIVDFYVSLEKNGKGFLLEDILQLWRLLHSKSFFRSRSWFPTSIPCVSMLYG